MPQTWNPETYSRDGAFVPQLGSGVLEWLAPKPASASSTSAAATAN